MTRKEIAERYTKLITVYENRLKKQKKRLFLLSVIRLVVFMTGVAGTVLAFSYTITTGIVVIVAMAVLFLFLLKQYSLLSAKNQFLENLIQINHNAYNALNGDFTAFNSGVEWKDKNHDFADDIDLFGEDSLFSYLNRTITGYGREILAGWLSDPLQDYGKIKMRQEAVVELAAMIEWRQEFMAYGLGKPLEKEDIASLRKWLETKDIIISRSWFKAFLNASPIVTVTLLILVILNLLSFYAFLSFFLFNLGMVGLFLKKSNKIHEMVSGKYIFLSSFENLISTFGGMRFSSAEMIDASKKLAASSGSVAMEIRKLSKIIEAFDSRFNMFAGFLLNGLILWDFQCITRLEKWKDSSAAMLPLWLETIGEVDALISLADHCYNNPEYALPEISEGAPVINASCMGHPLIDEKIRICNDFSINRRGIICIVTGANMAGKSTFLRSIAVNMILGMAGTTVCARKFSFTPCRLFTSMRTTDSLSKNESYFYAELKRLKILKEFLDSGEKIFFILDEILKGTNSEDKSAGSRLYLSRLAGSDGTGIIATHDLSLGEMENDFSGKIFNKCFEIEIAGESVLFDYVLRDGITRHMNAGILMRQMGII